MLDATLLDSVLARAGVESVLVEDVATLGLVCRVEPERATGVLSALKESEHEFSFMCDLFGVDTGEGVDVVYHLRSFSHDEDVFVKSHRPYGGELESVWELYPSVLMPERECAEMFGLKLVGHPNPKRLLLTDKVEAPLLKSVAIRTAEEVRDR